MFVSPCTLRSTQCAALIALAAAAGLMRVEATEARPNAPRTTSPDGTLVSRIELPRQAPAARFQIAFDAAAPWLALFQAAVHVAAQAPAGLTAPRPTAASAAPLPAPNFERGSPSARQHAYPFAVGPPAGRALTSPRADDTSLSADSAARRIAVSRVAVVSFSFSARPTRLGIPGPKLAGMFSSPSSALRGGSADPCFFPVLSAASGALSRRRAALPAHSPSNVS